MLLAALALSLFVGLYCTYEYLYLSSVNEIKTTWHGHVLYHLLVKLFVTCEVIEESHVLSSPWCFNFEMFAPFFSGTGDLTCAT